MFIYSWKKVDMFWWSFMWNVDFFYRTWCSTWQWSGPPVEGREIQIMTKWRNCSPLPMAKGQPSWKICEWDCAKEESLEGSCSLRPLCTLCTQPSFRFLGCYVWWWHWSTWKSYFISIYNGVCDGDGSLRKMDTCPTTLNMIFSVIYYSELHIPISSYH